jgi:bacterioferritin
VGKKGKAIAEVSVVELIEDLNKAYADEWLAYYQYWVGAQIAEGIGGHEVSEELMKTAKDELEHATELANRIIELGGVPLTHPKKILEKTGCGYMEPRDPMDFKRLLRDGIAGEGCAIDTYNKIAKKVFGKDHVTYQLVTHILSEEVGHEENFENMLGK